MQNTGNIILENWEGPKEQALQNDLVYHFAIRQRGVDLHFHIEQFFRDRRVSFHFFEELQTLIKICQRYPIDAIVIGGKGEFMDELQMVRAVKQNVFMSIIPVILYHPDPPVSTVVAAYENGTEDFIRGDWFEKLVEVRMRKVIERNRRDLSVNPSTKLPGPTMIELEIERQLEMKEEFAVCYADLDNFKAYNDYYGYVFGDRIIKLTGRVIKDIVFDLCPEGFVGHIAGDDFMFMVPREQIDPVCKWILKCFDAFIPFRYAEEDRARGFIRTTSRRNTVETYPILTLSIAVVVNERGTFSHIGELSKMLADLKKATKRLPGSNYMIERRRKY